MTTTPHRTTGLVEVTAQEVREALEGVLVPHLAKLVGERAAGHCMRITEVETELAASLVRRLRGALGPAATVCLLCTEGDLAAGQAPHDVGVSSTKLVELRNRSEGDGALPGPLLVFVPPGTRVSAEDSFGVATFEEVPLGDAYSRLAEHLLDQVPQRLRHTVDDLLAAVRDRPDGQPAADREIAHYLLTLQVNSYREQVCGAALYHFGLVPDFDLFTDPADVRVRVEKNHILVRKLTDSPRSERQRVLDLGLSDGDFAARLAAFATRCGLEEPATWTRRIVVDRENWPLSFGNWRTDERRRATVAIDVRELDLPSAGDNAEHLRDYPALSAMAGQPYLLTGPKGVRDISVRFAVQPDPRKVEGLLRFRVEIVSEDGGPIGRSAHVGKSTTSKREYSKKLANLHKIDWEEGWHYVRVVPLDADNQPLDVAPGAHDLPGGESERFYVVLDAETEEPPKRSAGRYAGLTQALRSLQLDARAAGEDPEHVAPTDIRWKAAGSRSTHRTLSARIHTAGNAEIRLSSILVQAQQQLLAHPENTGLRRLLLHPDGTAEMPHSDDADLAASLTGRPAEAYDAFVAARRDYFAAITGETDDVSEASLDNLPVSEAVDFERVREELATYAEAYAELVDAQALHVERATDSARGGALEALARIQQIDCVAATLTDAIGRRDTVLLVAPTHPLRALWLAAWSAMGLEWTSRLAAGDKKAVLSARDALLSMLAPLGFPFAVPRQDGRLMAAAENLTPYWGACLPSETADPRSVLGRLATDLSLPPESARTTADSGGALSGAALADRIERYLRLHPYVRTLVMNVINAGRAEIVADALLDLQRRATTRDLTYDIRLCVTDPEAPEAGAALLELQSAQSEISSAEAEAFLHTIGPTRTAKLVHSVRSVDEFTRNPGEFDAHLTVLIDAFGGEHHASAPVRKITHAPVHGLVQAAAADYEESDQQIVWRTIPRHGTALGIEGAEDLTTLMGRLPELLATATACVATAGQAPRNVPCTVLSLDTGARDLLYQAHRSGDWVVTIDRTLGVEYFDNAGRHGRPEYVIDYSPSQGSGLGHQIMVSSNSIDELRTLLGPTAEQHGLDVEERHLNTFFDQLRLLSGNLAFKLASTAPNQRTEVLGLSLARLYLDYQDVLRNQIVVPLDAHPELYAEVRRQARELGDAVSFQRSDLALFHLDAARRIITCSLVEVKCYTALDDIASYQRLKAKVTEQLERSRTVLAESFDPDLTTPDRVDRPVKNLALSSLLRAYLERAARHGTLQRSARVAAHELLDSLDDGYRFRFTQSGLIFDLARGGTDQETDGAVEFHRIGHDLITELVDAIPTVRPGAREDESVTGTAPTAGEAPGPDGAATAPTLALLRLSLPRLADAGFRRDDEAIAEPNPATDHEPESPADEAAELPAPQPAKTDRKLEEPTPPTRPTPSTPPPPHSTAGTPALPENPLHERTSSDAEDYHNAPTATTPEPALQPHAPPLLETGRADVYLGVTRPSPQHGVLGEAAGHTVALDLNETHTISLFGVQGGGKSYTLGSIIEAASLPTPPVNVLPHPLATVVFHYSKTQDYAPEFTSMVNPNDDSAQLAALKQCYGAEPRALGDVLLLAPEAQVDERRAEYPNIEVQPLAFSSAELKAEHWKFLLGAVGNRSTYIKQIAKAIRKHRNNLTLDVIRQELTDSRMPDHIKDLAEDRLDLAAEYIDDGVRLTSLIRPGRLVIVDLRDDLIEKDDALGLFVVLMQLFADARDNDRRFNKLVVFDEAHKYIDSPDLVAGLVESVREMRHKGMSILVASQDPPSVPVQLIELSNHVILHKFTSPAWLKHLQKANAALSSLTAEKLAHLGPGEAYVWSSKATDPAFTHGAVRIRCRPRVTKHGGGTKTASGE
ncbi:ATP-binding protein [Streptomyces sp. ISID311]|uniref:methylation-associated defense system ATP-binding protein MAD8 n=1 Tax=Streptomyces sp. ISID311 TaxID=2601673 RepID=UPI0011BD314B|nr:ATP-binding protein [Streptomyces sp. ISID311]TXC95218.1 ATP-binding protein [Streptomyces sp. ISID311]